MPKKPVPEKILREMFRLGQFNIQGYSLETPDFRPTLPLQPDATLHPDDLRVYYALALNSMKPKALVEFAKAVEIAVKGGHKHEPPNRVPGWNGWRDEEGWSGGK